MGGGHDEYNHLRESADAARAPLNDAEREAFRAYMHDLNRKAAVAQGEDPDAICPLCGEVDHHEHDDSEWEGNREWQASQTQLGTPPWLHRPGDGCVDDRMSNPNA